MNKFTKFFSDDAGAITTDWLPLTAGIVLLGVMVAYAIFNGSMKPMVSNYNSALEGDSTNVVLGEIVLP